MKKHNPITIEWLAMPKSKFGHAFPKLWFPKWHHGPISCSPVCGYDPFVDCAFGYPAATENMKRCPKCVRELDKAGLI